MSQLPGWSLVDDPSDALQGTPAVVLLGPGQAPGDWEAARSRWPERWVVEGPRGRVCPLDMDGLIGLRTGARTGTLVVDRVGAVVWANRALVRMLGFDSLEELGQVAALVAPCSPDWDPPDHGNRALHRDGSAIAVALEAVAISTAGLLVLDLRDVRDERRVRDELAQASRYHSALVANAQDAIAIVDADGIVQYHSPAARTLLGLAPEELVGRPLPLAFAEDRLRVGRAIAAACAVPGGTERVVYQVRDLDDRLHWLESHLTNHLDNPMVGGLVMNTRDITERRALERGLRDADRVRVAGLLGATVAHDMNNMISVVLDGLDLVEAAVAADPDVGQWVAVMRQAMARSSELARRLTAFGRRDTTPVRRVDLGAVAEKLRSMLLPVMRRGQELSVSVAPGEHPVCVDVGELEQAIVNLVVNARDAVGVDGHVDVAVERRPGGDHPRVAVVVTDDGAGMSAETRARIFEPFFSTKGLDAGSGLGMVMVRTFASDAGGDVRVQSEEGRGTRIELVLPVDVITVESGC